MTILRVVIVDDEPLARRNIHSLLKNTEDVEIVGECRSGVEAIDVIERIKPDLIFLDVQMPEMNGFEVLENLQSDDLPEIVFVTAYDQFALKAFEVHAIDYLLKPFDDERFAKALERARVQITQNKATNAKQQLMSLLKSWHENGEDGSQQLNSRLLIREVGRISFVPIHEIDWIEASDQYVTLHSAAKTYLIRDSMQDLETRLPANRFFRIHRSFLVNLQSVKELQIDKHGEYHALLKDGSVLKVSRSRRFEFEEALQ
jgi:two-component system LytT family response regulator